MPGDYFHIQAQYTRKVGYDYITSTEQTTRLPTGWTAVKSANHRQYVQRITLSITTHANAKVALTVQSSNATPVVIASRTDLTAAAGVPDVIVWDFGPQGIPVALGESVRVLWSTGGSGPVGCMTIEGYEKLESTTSYLAGASGQ